VTTPTLEITIEMKRRAIGGLRKHPAKDKAEQSSYLLEGER